MNTPGSPSHSVWSLDSSSTAWAQELNGNTGWGSAQLNQAAWSSLRQADLRVSQGYAEKSLPEKNQRGKKRRKGGRKEGKKQAHKQVKEYVSAAGRGFLNSELCRNGEEAMIQVGEDPAGLPGLSCPQCNLTFDSGQPAAKTHCAQVCSAQTPSLPPSSSHPFISLNFCD